jgi:hypothetical protein
MHGMHGDLREEVDGASNAWKRRLIDEFLGGERSEEASLGEKRGSRARQEDWQRSWRGWMGLLLFSAMSSDQGSLRLLDPRKLCSRDRKNATMVATVVAILMAEMLALWQKDILSKGVTEFWHLRFLSFEMCWGHEMWMDCVCSVRARRLLGFLSVSCVSSVASEDLLFGYSSSLMVTITRLMPLDNQKGDGWLWRLDLWLITMN